MSLLAMVVMNIVCIEGNSKGAPPEACDSLLPSRDPSSSTPCETVSGHISPAQTSRLPCSLDLSSLVDDVGLMSYIPGQTYCEFPLSKL